MPAKTSMRLISFIEARTNTSAKMSTKYQPSRVNRVLRLKNIVGRGECDQSARKIYTIVRLTRSQRRRRVAALAVAVGSRLNNRLAPVLQMLLSSCPNQ